MTEVHHEENLHNLRASHVPGCPATAGYAETATNERKQMSTPEPPPPTPRCQCGVELRWDTRAGGHWKHRKGKQPKDHEPTPK